MNAFHWFFGIVIGAGSAYAFLKTQGRSVKMIAPDRPGISVGLVVGGAFLRWALLFLLLALAIHQSILAAIALFAAFMVVRMILLFFFRGTILRESTRVKGVKD